MKIITDIDTCSIGRYRRISDTGDLRNLIIKAKWYDIFRQKKNVQMLRDAWEVVQEQLYDLLLTDPDFVTALKDEREVVLKQAKAAISGKTIDRLHANAAKVREEQLQSTRRDVSLAEALTNLEQYLRFPVDEDKMSVRRYFLHAMSMKRRTA